jgi:hypothetical protein
MGGRAVQRHTPLWVRGRRVALHGGSSLSGLGRKAREAFQLHWPGRRWLLHGTAWELEQGLGRHDMGRALKALLLGAAGRQAGVIVGSCGETFASRATTQIVRLALVSGLPSFTSMNKGPFTDLAISRKQPLHTDFVVLHWEC